MKSPNLRFILTLALLLSIIQRVEFHELSEPSAGHFHDNVSTEAASIQHAHDEADCCDSPNPSALTNTLRNTRLPNKSYRSKSLHAVAHVDLLDYKGIAEDHFRHFLTEAVSTSYQNTPIFLQFQSFLC
jgi:hypothetical protein